LPHIFLQGRSGVGKSSLLREIFMPHIAVTRGFVVQRLTENGKKIGFRATSLENGFPPPTAEYAGQPGIFILRGEFFIHPLEEAVLRAERECRACKFVLLDEIGGVELRSSVFMESLERILSSGTPVAGVFKSRENLERASRTFGLERAYEGLHAELEARLRRGGELITVTEQDTCAVREQLKKFIMGVSLCQHSLRK